MPNSKRDESYNADHFPEIHIQKEKEEILSPKIEKEKNTKNIPSEESSIQTKSRNKPEKESDNGTPEILASVEISDGANKKPFRGLGLLNKSQLKLASYIKQNKNVTLEGTKRFMDKSGEYYLKNIQLQNKRKDNKRQSLNKPQNLENCLNKKDFNKIKRKASKIVTILPENSLTPIPKKKDAKDNSLANNIDKKELNDAQRTAVFIRRMEYSTSMKRQMNEDKSVKDKAKKIALIQEWWRAMFKIIKLQKNIRGFLFRKKLMNNLEHQEKLLQFITEFDNIHNYHLYKQFMDNLKKKRDYEKNKLMEKCEDFNEKLDNLEKMHNYNNFKDCFKKWKDDTKKQKKEALDNLCNKLKDVLLDKEKEDKEDAMNKIKEKEKDEENKMDDKINNFREQQAKKKFFNDLMKLHKENKDLKDKEKLKENLNKWKDINDELKKRKKILDKLKRYKENELKKKEEEEKNKLVISSQTNNFEVVSDKPTENISPKKENNISISQQNELNIINESPKKLLLSQNYQSFSLIAPEKIKFEFYEPLKKSQKLDNYLSIQIDNVITFAKNKRKEKEDEIKNALDKINEIYQKAKDEGDKELKEEFMDKLKRNNNLQKLAEKLDDVINKRLEKNALENIKDKAKENDEEEINIIKPIRLLQKIVSKNKENEADNNMPLLERKSLLLTLKRPEDKDNKDENNPKLLERKSLLLTLKKPENKDNDDDNNNTKLLERKSLLLTLKKPEDKDKKEEDKIDILERKSFLYTMKKPESNENKEEEKNNYSPKKRVAYRRSPKKSRLRNKKYLKNALDKWRRNSKLMNNEELYDKYKKKVVHDLFKIYKKNQDNSLKEYFDRWKNIENKEDNKENKENNEEKKEDNEEKKEDNEEKKEDNEEKEEKEEKEEILKYKKKPRIEYKDDIIEDEDQETIKEKDTFKPVYVLPKRNLYKQMKEENPNIDESIHEPTDTNNNTNSINEPYVKKYGQRNYPSKENSIYIKEEINPSPNDQYLYSNLPPKKHYKKHPFNLTNESSSDSEDSYLSGMTLIQNNKEIKEPRNYTSQSFFIDKNNTKNKSPNKNNESIQINKNEIYKINQIPNMMKGDFDTFIEKNPKILENKNPRIQVTRTTCDLTNIINKGNINININTNNINDNKFLEKIVKNCDHDLYSNQKSQSKKDKWYSMTIPLNQLKQGLDYKKAKNKNEMIEKNLNDNRYNNYKVIKPYNIENNEGNNYTLQEMNHSQYYKSPVRSPKKNKFGDNYEVNDSVIKIPGKQRRNIHKSMSPFDSNRRRNNYNSEI